MQKKPSWGYWGKLSSVQIAQLSQFLLDDQAETLADIQAYLKNNLGVSYTIGGGTRLKIKLKTGRPVNIRQQPGAIEEFKDLRQSYADNLIFFHNKLRAVTRTELSRKWGPIGHIPIAPVRIGYANTYLYLTICLFTGEGFGAFLPKLNSK